MAVPVLKREFGPVLPVAAEPKPFNVPRMADSSKLPKHDEKSWRVQEVEIEAVETHCAQLLKDRWPRIAEGNTRNWLRAAMGDRTFLLIRTANVVGMFYFTVDTMEPLPIVREKFVRGGNAPVEEFAEIYSAATEWAKSIKARECHFGEDTDAPMERMIAALHVKKRATYTRSFE